MNARIKLPNGPEAAMDDDGNWTCAAPHIARMLQAMGELWPPQDYLPDPFQVRVKQICEATGAELIERNIPPDDSPPGLVH